MCQIVKVAFYKKYNDTIYDRLIALWSRSKYTHVELVINGLWYSSSPRDGGVRVKGITANLDHWDCIELQLHPFDVDKIIKFFEAESGKPYDWFGIVMSQIFPLKIQESDKWFCSEIVHHALLLGGVRLQNDCSHCVSPSDLYKLLQDVK